MRFIEMAEDNSRADFTFPPLSSSRVHDFLKQQGKGGQSLMSVYLNFSVMSIGNTFSNFL